MFYLKAEIGNKGKEVKKVGYKRIDKGNGGKVPPLCMSCGKIATKLVTFQDDWCTIKIVLCERCAGMKYELLHLQKTIKFTGAA